MRSRDNKTKILYTLNYFRSIQKRLAIDLREFGSRERVDAHFKEPMAYPKEGHKNAVTLGMANLGETSMGINNYAGPIDPLGGKKLMVFD